MPDRPEDRSRKGYGFEPLSYTVFNACIAVAKQMGPHCMGVDWRDFKVILTHDESHSARR